MSRDRERLPGPALRAAGAAGTPVPSGGGGLLRLGLGAGLSGYGLFDAALFIHMFILALIYSHSYAFLGGASLFLYYAMAANFGFLALCLFRNLTAFLLVAVMLTIALFYLAVFSLNFGTPVSGRSLGALVGIFSAGAFGVYAQRFGLQRAIWILYLASLAYLVVFIYFTLKLDPYEIAQARKGDDIIGAVRSAHGSDDRFQSEARFRIVVSGFNFAVGFFYSLAKARSFRSIRWVASLIAFSVAIVICDFRFQLASFILLGLFSITPLNLRTKTIVGAVVTGVFMIAVLACAIFQANMYDFFQADQTGAVRVGEALLANSVFLHYPIFGTGYYSVSDDLTLVYGSNFMALSDIGYLGELLQFGIFGFVLLFLCNLFVSLFALRVVQQPQIDMATKRTLVDLWLFVAMTELLSTYLWEEAGGMLLALSIGYVSRYGWRDVARPVMRALPAPRRRIQPTS